jgi:hypothetical protein
VKTLHLMRYSHFVFGKTNLANGSMNKSKSELLFL